MSCPRFHSSVSGKLKTELACLPLQMNLQPEAAGGMNPTPTPAGRVLKGAGESTSLRIRLPDFQHQ